MKHRKLHIAWSVMWGVVAVLLCVFWVRSYWKADYVQPWRSHSVVSLRGTLFVDKQLVQATSANMSAGNVLPASLQTKQYSFVPFSSGLAVPYWLVAALPIAIAAAPWRRWRFSLRTLLVAATLVAAV